jgi:hypothetical protein
MKQNRLTSEKINKWLDQEPEEFCTTEEMRRNWIRNKTLIDLNEIPKDVEESIKSEYALQLNKKRKTKDDILNYLINNGLTRFMADLQDF